MTPPAAAAAPRTRTRRSAPAPRRVSGPARGRAAAYAAPPPLALRLGGAVHTIAEHRWLERLIRGRAWIGIVGVGLIGIVFMQVSMLRMNAGIGRSVDKASILERQNAAMRADISNLSVGDRIAAEASQMGLILPQTTPRFLDARSADARRALRSMTPPGQGIVPSTTTQTVTPLGTVPTLGGTCVAPQASGTLAPDGTTVTPTPATQEPVVTPQGTATTAGTTTPTQSTTPAQGTTAAPTTQQQPTQTTQPVAQPTATSPPPTTGGAEAGGAQ